MPNDLIRDPRQVDLEDLLSTTVVATKVCVACRETKPRSEFHNSQANADGLQAYCKACSRAQLRTWHASNPEANGRHKREAYAADPARPILASIRARAKQNGIPCNLSLPFLRELLATTRVCPVLGIPLHHRVTGVRQGPSDNSPSIDRLQPELGYVERNVAVISQRANRLKNDATLSEARAIVAWMEKAHGNLDRV